MGRRFKKPSKLRICGTKRKYDTKEEAEDAMFAMIRRTGTRLASVHVYQCPACKKLHIGHKQHKGKR